MQLNCSFSLLGIDEQKVTQLCEAEMVKGVQRLPCTPLHTISQALKEDLIIPAFGASVGLCFVGPAWFYALSMTTVMNTTHYAYFYMASKF